MKKVAILFAGLTALLLISAISPLKESSSKAFEKIVFMELTVDQDSVLFKPYSKAWNEHWKRSSDLTVSGSDVMNYEKYNKSFADRTDNLWTILHPLVIEGKVQVYYPYASDSYGMGVWDDGEMRYPVMNEERSETFLTSEAVREQLCWVMGMLGPISDVPLVDEYGDNIIVTNPDGTQSFVYANPDYYWYDDQQIVKYKLRIRIEVNKKGKEKKRVIEAFCPVVNRLNEMGEVVGENDVLWFDFAELKPTLKASYFLNSEWKPISYQEYILEKVRQADFRSEE